VGASQTVAFFGFDQARLIDITGPLEVFSTANAVVGEKLYELEVLSVDGSEITSGAGTRLSVDGAVADGDGQIDILVVPGSFEWDRVSRDEKVLAALRIAVDRSRRIASVCAGSFLLAEIGVLDGRRVTTIWDLVETLTERYPEVDVDGRPIFIVDGDVYTSAGGTAGIDLTLAIVEGDHGPELARLVAQYLVVFMQRPGDAAQFSARMLARPTKQPELRSLLDGIAEDPAADHRLAALSDRVGFSERHLARLSNAISG
jgi:transcriptional regulator GlxA family with amidase domain